MRGFLVEYLNVLVVIIILWFDIVWFGSLFVMYHLEGFTILLLQLIKQVVLFVLLLDVMAVLVHEVVDIHQFIVGGIRQSLLAFCRS